MEQSERKDLVVEVSVREDTSNSERESSHDVELRTSTSRGGVITEGLPTFRDHNTYYITRHQGEEFFKNILEHTIFFYCSQKQFKSIMQNVCCSGIQNQKGTQGLRKGVLILALISIVVNAAIGTPGRKVSSLKKQFQELPDSTMHTVTFNQRNFHPILDNKNPINLWEMLVSDKAYGTQAGPIYKTMMRWVGQ